MTISFEFDVYNILPILNLLGSDIDIVIQTISIIILNSYYYIYGRQGNNCTGRQFPGGDIRGLFRQII